MPATASATPTRLAPASVAVARPSADAALSPERVCPYCCAEHAAKAKKCRACGEWVVRTSAGATAALMRLVGWLWVGLSLLAAVALWYVGSVVRLWVLVRSVDPAVTPLVLDLILFGLVGAVLLLGCTVGVGLVVLASLVPRRPRWWT